MLLCNKLQTFGVITAYAVYSQAAGAGVQSHHIKRLFRVLASKVEKPPAAERQNKTRADNRPWLSVRMLLMDESTETHQTAVSIKH